jgi:hypothetical protein
MGLAAAAGALAANPQITSVIFTGNQSHPTISIRGQGLGKRPSPNPNYHPLGHPLCPPQPTRPQVQYGLDYGTSLYIEDSGAQPVWSAGRYRPSLNELDCVGIRLTAFTPTHIVFHLGVAYPKLKNTNGAVSTYILREGDAFMVGVNGATFTGTVHYRH